MINQIKKFVSNFTDKKIPLSKIGTTIGEERFENIPSIKDQAKPESRNSAKYILNDSVGNFEMIGPIKTSGNLPIRYKLRCSLTGEEIIVSGKLFTLLFKKEV